VYNNLAEMAVHTVPNAGGLRVFVGSRDEGFYVDLGVAFDLINPRPGLGVDQTSGYNVSTLAVEIPKPRLRAAGDTDGIIGVWATASRRNLPVCNTGSVDSPGPCAPLEVANAPLGQPAPGKGTQVSRLANPLFNEALDPLRVKDLYNATDPTADERDRLQFILNPGTSQSNNALIPRLKDFIPCTDLTNRNDQVASWMLGYPAGVVNGFPGNRETQTTRPAIAEMMRLNYNIPPSLVPNPLGVLGGDFAGMPNGRRVTDSTVQILLKLWAGALQGNFGGTACPAALALTDNILANDVPYLSVFPYLGLPHDGFNHTHTHQGP